KYLECPNCDAGKKKRSIASPGEGNSRKKVPTFNLDLDGFSSSECQDIDDTILEGSDDDTLQEKAWTLVTNSNENRKNVFHVLQIKCNNPETPLNKGNINDLTAEIRKQANGPLLDLHFTRTIQITVKACSNKVVEKLLKVKSLKGKQVTISFPGN